MVIEKKSNVNGRKNIRVENKSNMNERKNIRIGNTAVLDSLAVLIQSMPVRTLSRLSFPN